MEGQKYEKYNKDLLFGSLDQALVAAHNDQKRPIVAVKDAYPEDRRYAVYVGWCSVLRKKVDRWYVGQETTNPRARGGVRRFEFLDGTSKEIVQGTEEEAKHLRHAKTIVCAVIMHQGFKDGWFYIWSKGRQGGSQRKDWKPAQLVGFDSTNTYKHLLRFDTDHDGSKLVRMNLEYQLLDYH